MDGAIALVKDGWRERLGSGFARWREHRCPAVSSQVNHLSAVFGRFFRYLLSLGDAELIDLDREHPRPEFRTCRLQRSTEAPPGYPTETWPVDMAREVLGGGIPDAGPWRFTMTSRFQREARSAFTEALRAVVEICHAPMSARSNTIQRLSGHGGRLWRYRLGDRRLVYEPDEARRVVRFLRFGPGGDVYCGL